MVTSATRGNPVLGRQLFTHVMSIRKIFNLRRLEDLIAVVFLKRGLSGHFFATGNAKGV